MQKAEIGISEVIHKILQREWMQERESIRMKIHSGVLSEEEVVELAKQFDELKKNPPKVRT